MLIKNGLIIKEENKMKTQTIINELRDKWYEDCLKYNIPVNPSDVQDIVEELLELKNEKEN